MKDNLIANSIARYIVRESYRHGVPVTNLQLQKMMYILQISYCKTFQRLLFDDEFEAWEYGPVLPSVFEEFEKFGGTSIQKDYEDSEFDRIYPFDKRAIDVVMVVMACKLSPHAMASITNKEGGAWDVTYMEGEKRTIRNGLVMKDALSDM